VAAGDGAVDVGIDAQPGAGAVLDDGVGSEQRQRAQRLQLGLGRPVHGGKVRREHADQRAAARDQRHGLHGACVF
jgi:hypothetical protein